MKQQPIRTQSMLIEDELQRSFLDYAMSVIVSRALPDVRDGLKPVHRRILYTMHQLGFYHNKPYHKAVRVVGDVLGRYHPHGDQPVYQAMVGLVQDFAKRHPLLDGQGNWGSIDGDNAAAMRYTEVRMQKIAQELLADIDKNTVPFVPNFDESTVEPTVLPSRIPNLLVNGTSGIAVGMATSIPPHNLSEIVDACCALLQKGHSLTDDELFELVPGPDFPTGGVMCGRSGVLRAYRTGRGNLVLRGVTEAVETKKGTSLIVTELPYQVVKSELVMKIAQLVREKVIEGISDIRDESDRHGIRLVLDLRRGEVPEVVLNNLYQHTSLQMNVAVLMLGLVDNRPMVLTLRQLLQEFLNHREVVVAKRTQFELDRARDREHILQGLTIALQHLDDAIAMIKAARSPEEAAQALHAQFSLSTAQTSAILEMRLQRLTGLEQEKIANELVNVRALIAEYTALLADRALLQQVIIGELQELKTTYGNPRRTRIEGAVDALSDADLIPDDEVVVTLTRKGYIKRAPLTLYGVQHRGGKGKMAIGSLEDSEDVIEDIFATKNHDELLFFTNMGRVYGLQVFEIPEGSRIAKGRAIINILPLQEGERVVKLLCVRDLAGKFICMVSEQGTIKRVEATAFDNIRSTGIRAITLHEGDALAFCAMSSGEDSIVLASREGKGIRFHEAEVRAMGRQAAGVIGIRLQEGDIVVGMQVVREDQDLLFATARGFGKRVGVAEFRVAHRGGQGVITIPTDERNGQVIGVVPVTDQSHVLLIDTVGKIIRLPSSEIRTMGRQAKGVRLIRLDASQTLSAIVTVPAGENGEEASDAVVAAPQADTAKSASNGPAGEA